MHGGMPCRGQEDTVCGTSHPYAKPWQDCLRLGCIVRTLRGDVVRVVGASLYDARGKSGRDQGTSKWSGPDPDTHVNDDDSRRDRQPFRVRQVDRIVSNVGVQVLLAAAKPSGSLAVSALTVL
jgi:hypothetical protein